MPGGGFEQCYNTEAAAVADSLLVIANDVVQATNDKQQVAPMLGKLGALPGELGEVETLLADTRYLPSQQFRHATMPDNRLHNSADGGQCV